VAGVNFLINIMSKRGYQKFNIDQVDTESRLSSQFPMPFKIEKDAIEPDGFNVYPFCDLGKNKIYNGYESLADWIIKERTVIIEGYVGLFWDNIQSELHQTLTEKGFSVNWLETADFLKPESEVNEMVAPFLGSADSVWGTRCTLELGDLYQVERLEDQLPKLEFDINIVIGSAAIHSNWDAAIIYIDLPKNELQFRMRAGSIYNLGSSRVDTPYLMYKRFYFVDWVLLNKHKKRLLQEISVLADGQWHDTVNWMFKADFTEGLDWLARSVIRVRPWFEPSVWGGQWIKGHIPNLNKDIVNYAWAFSLIVPENGLVFESDGFLLEASFDFLMYHNHEQVLGKHAERFKDEFPIRINFLDTFDGGDLSLQCHPSLDYIRETFGENITQDETYYILDCKDDADLFLGFKEDIDPGKFYDELVNSQINNTELQVEDFVQKFRSKKHELYLIPNGTIHSAGEGNMVLEISGTPYIFTFKLYDWLRLDLDGKPRPINIDHGFKNLDFDLRGDQVVNTLISLPEVVEKWDDYELEHLPTHHKHFYDLHRIDFDNEVEVETENCCHVMTLVEGDTVRLETETGISRVFAYAETFIVPAAAKSYKLTNLGKGRAKVLKVFLK